MANSSQTHYGEGDNVGRDKNIYNHFVSMDVGRLVEILDTSAERIKDLFSRVEKDVGESETEVDERTIAIDVKNRINDLTEFYNRFIKEHEGKLLALDIFFKDNDYMERIEKAANYLKMHIFAKGKRKSDKLDTAMLDDLIQEHNKAVVDVEDKDLMNLIIFYLYRFCYIGAKNEA